MRSGQEQQVQERQNAWGELHSDQLAAAKAYEKCPGLKKPWAVASCDLQMCISHAISIKFM